MCIRSSTRMRRSKRSASLRSCTRRWSATPMGAIAVLVGRPFARGRHRTRAQHRGHRLSGGRDRASARPPGRAGSDRADARARPSRRSHCLAGRPARALVRADAGAICMQLRAIDGDATVDRRAGASLSAGRCPGRAASRASRTCKFWTLRWRNEGAGRCACGSSAPGTLSADPRPRVAQRIWTMQKRTSQGSRRSKRRGISKTSHGWKSSSSDCSPIHDRRAGRRSN